MHHTSIRVDSMKILTRRELAVVLGDLKAKALKSRNAWTNLILVRLACCWGFRVSEIAGLQVGDVRVDARPHLRIRRGASKGGRSRVVPLWWDAGTLRDLAEWKATGNAPDARSSAPYARTAARPSCPVTRYASGSRPRVGCSDWNACRRSPFTTAGTRSSVMPWLVVGRWPRCATRRSTRT